MVWRWNRSLTLCRRPAAANWPSATPEPRSPGAAPARAAGTVTFDLASDDTITGSSLSTAVTLNGNLLPVTQVVTFDNGSGGSGAETTATTTWAYQSDAGRYEGQRRSNLVPSRRRHPGPMALWTRYAYDSATGWVTKMVSPFKNSSASDSDDAHHLVEEYAYDIPTGAGFTGAAGDPADPHSAC